MKGWERKKPDPVTLENGLLIMYSKTNDHKKHKSPILQVGKFTFHRMWVSNSETSILMCLLGLNMSKYGLL